MKKAKKKVSYVYVTKSVNKDMTSHHDKNFKYPESGMVEAPDWKNTDKCGNGLHGYLWGEGDGSLANYTDQAVWLLIRVNPEDGLVVMGNKCKFRRGEVVMVSDYKTIAEELKKYLPADRIYKVIGGTATAGYKGTATAGYKGTATAGDEGTATAGDEGTATAGDQGTATAGDEGTATAGYKGTATAGDEGTATAGDEGTATAGYKGTATAGYKGTATAGYKGTATAGDEGTATAGDEGIIIITYWDDAKSLWRKKVGIIGDDGLEPNAQYTLDSTHNFVKVSK